MKKLLFTFCNILCCIFIINAQQKDVIRKPEGFKSLKSMDVYSFNEDISTFQSIKETGILATPNDWDDGVTNSISIGFNFVFNGEEFTELTINTNGTVNLGDNPVNEETNNIESQDYYNLLAPLWDDLKFWNNGTTDGLYYLLDGASGSRILTIEFYQVGRYNVDGNDNGYINFQVKLFEEDNHIEFIYDDLSNAANWHIAAGASIGLNSFELGTTVFASVTPDNALGALISYDTPNNNITKEIVAGMAQGTRFSFTPPTVSDGIDIEVNAITSPVSGLLTNEEKVIVKLVNLGIQIENGLELSFEIINNESEEVIATGSGGYENYPIASLATINYEFNNQIDLLANLEYTVNITATIDNDVNETNNYFSDTINGVIIKDILFNNGGFVTHAGAGYEGADVSAVQENLGLQDFGYNSNSLIGYRNADEFTIPEDTSWVVSGFSFFNYQTGGGTESTINYIDFKIWDEKPSESGTPIYDFTEENMLSATFWTGAYRTASSDMGNNERAIMQNVCKFESQHQLVLTSGTYWIDYASDGEILSGPWQIFVSIRDSVTTGNGVHFGTEGWVTMIDEGTETTQGMPFLVHGTLYDPSAITGNKAQVLLYPNPTKGMVTLKSDKKIVYNIYNAGGRSVAKGSINREGIVNLNDQPSGIYLIQITSIGSTEIRKVIIE